MSATLQQKSVTGMAMRLNTFKIMNHSWTASCVLITAYPYNQRLITSQEHGLRNVDYVDCFWTLMLLFWNSKLKNAVQTYVKLTNLRCSFDDSQRKMLNFWFERKQPLLYKKEYIEAFFSVSVHVRKTKSFKFLW